MPFISSPSPFLFQPVFFACWLWCAGQKHAATQIQFPRRSGSLSPSLDDTPGTWKREKLRELAIRYFSTGLLFFYHREGVPTPRVKHITDKCPFVTKLTLTNWMGSNGQVTLFWEGLPLLEEVELEKCEELRDVAFVGKEWEDPVFLKLKHLKKVSLKGLDVMPKVTDLVFGLVFRHLKIKRFCLTCETPLKSVTVLGIESLLNGEFNNSVEKFPFDDWSLDGVSDEAFLELKQKFRATHMI